jgi:hypothetical protein
VLAQLYAKFTDIDKDVIIEVSEKLFPNTNKIIGDLERIRKSLSMCMKCGYFDPNESCSVTFNCCSSFEAKNVFLYRLESQLKAEAAILCPTCEVPIERSWVQSLNLVSDDDLRRLKLQ